MSYGIGDIRLRMNTSFGLNNRIIEQSRIRIVTAEADKRSRSPAICNSWCQRLLEVVFNFFGLAGALRADVEFNEDEFTQLIRRDIRRTPSRSTSPPAMTTDIIRRSTQQELLSEGRQEWPRRPAQIAYHMYLDGVGGEALSQTSLDRQMDK